MTDNILLLTDSYKVSHSKQYPPGTTKVYSYFESRGGRFDNTVFFGLQYILKRYLNKQITAADIAEAMDYYTKHLGEGSFNLAGWNHILRDHGGWLPVSIKAVPEGSVVDVRNVLMTVESTCPKCFWVTNYLETLLVQVWYPTTVATQSREMKKIIAQYLDATADNLDGLPFKLHDFGCRGVSSMESAGIGGAAHLVNFKGTDTVPALVVSREYYGEDMAAYSVPAAEHSTITSWGRDGEADAYENMLVTYPKGIVSVVSDSYDIFNACGSIWGKELADMVLARDGKLVIRPDSGDPATVVPRLLEILGKAFGFTINSKGYKVLNPKVGLIQGDGINFESAEQILEAVASKGWSTDNVVFGMGGALLQQLNRDTQRFAFKCSYVEVDGIGRDVFKDPVGAPWKASKKGRLRLIHDKTNGYLTVPDDGDNVGYSDLLQEVYRDGEIMVETTLSDVRSRAQIHSEATAITV